MVAGEQKQVVWDEFNKLLTQVETYLAHWEANTTLDTHKLVKAKRKALRKEVAKLRAIAKADLFK